MVWSERAESERAESERAESEGALPGGADHSRVRASNADRDGVINTLKSGYVLGFVTKDEFDVRVSHTLTARTYAELAVVTTDLPVWLAGSQPPSRLTPTNVSAPATAALRPVDRAIVACCLLAAVAFAAAIVSADGWLALGAVGSAMASLILVAVQARATRRPRQPGGKPPGPGPIEAGAKIAAGSALRSPHAIRQGRAGDVRPQSRRRPRPLLSC